MVRNIFLTALFIVLVIPVLACAHVGKENLVEVRIVSDSGEEFAKYRTYPRFRQEGKFFYMEAVKGQRYSIQVTNQSDRRIGVVMAVDGRNIIDGKKSDLKQNERMYIIGPYETNIFEGWRTGMDRTNRFYFTEQSDSYAEKVFADASAIGTIALAVYRERLPEIIPYRGSSSRMKDVEVHRALPMRAVLLTVLRRRRMSSQALDSGRRPIRLPGWSTSIRSIQRPKKSSSNTSGDQNSAEKGSSIAVRKIDSGPRTMNLPRSRKISRGDCRLPPDVVSTKP